MRDAMPPRRCKLAPFGFPVIVAALALANDANADAGKIAEVRARLFIRSDLVTVRANLKDGRPVTYELTSVTDNLYPREAALLTARSGCHFPSGRPVSITVRTQDWAFLPTHNKNKCSAQDGLKEEPVTKP